MVQPVILFAWWWVPVVVLGLALGLSGRYRVNWTWFALGAASYAVYSAVGHATLPDTIGQLPAEYRWLSRSAQLAAVLAMIALAWKKRPSLAPDAMGLTLKQARGSWPFALAGLGALAILGALPGGIGVSEAPSAVALAYHLTLPGLEEELIYRALLPGLLAAALDGAHPLGWALVMSNIVFALAHGIYLDGGGVAFNPFMIGFTLLAGAILSAIRVRTGSLLFPAIGHNLLGLAARFA